MDRADALLLTLLESSGRPYTLIDHPRADTAASAATERGTPLHIGGKSLVFKLRDGFGVFVLSGARRTDGRALRRHLGLQKLRFAHPGELLGLTGLEPGCVPPFGRPIFDLPLYVDAFTASQPEIAFALASHTRSVRMRTEDYLAIARPTDVYAFSKPE